MGVKLGKSSGRKRAHAVMADINVTPLVDVMLVLLIIFMITAPLLTAGVEINLPKSQARALKSQDNGPLEVSIDSKGNVSVGNTPVRVERLKAMLSAIALENADRRVYVRADSKLSYGQVMAVMSAVSASGFSKIALITDPTSAQ